MSSTIVSKTAATLKQARENAQALQESEGTLRAYAERLEILHEIDRAILAAQSPQAIAQAALAHLQPLIPSLLSSVMVFDLERQQMRGLITYVRGKRVPELEITFEKLTGFNIAGLVAGQVQSVPDMSQAPTLSPIHQSFYKDGMRSYINVPLLTQGKLVGTLNLGSESPHFFTESRLEIAQEIAASLAIAIHQAHLREQVQQNAVIKSQLLHEVNHRVGNNLMAIIGLLHTERRFAPESAGQIIGPALDRLEQRIAALAEVHKILSANSWAPVNLQELIMRLTRQTLNTLLTTHKFEINVSPTEVSVSPRQANHLALVISELAANVAAHAHTAHTPGHVDVAIEAPDHTIEIIYRDDGPGYPDAILHESRFNVGLYLIQRIVTATLRGRLELRNDNGAVAIIHFERENPADPAVS